MNDGKSRRVAWRVNMGSVDYRDQLGEIGRNVFRLDRNLRSRRGEWMNYTRYAGAYSIRYAWAWLSAACLRSSALAVDSGSRASGRESSGARFAWALIACAGLGLLALSVFRSW